MRLPWYLSGYSIRRSASTRELSSPRSPPPICCPDDEPLAKAPALGIFQPTLTLPTELSHILTEEIKPTNFTG